MEKVWGLLEREDLHHCLLPLHHYLLLPLHHYTLLPLLPLLLPGLLPCMGHPIKTTFTTTLQSPLSSLLPLGSTPSPKDLLNLSLVEWTLVRQQAAYWNKKIHRRAKNTTKEEEGEEGEDSSTRQPHLATRQPDLNQTTSLGQHIWSKREIRQPSQLR